MLREVKEKLFLCGIAIITALTVLPLFHIIYSVAAMGLPVLLRGGLEFLTGTLAPPGEGLGGIGPAILGTFILTFLASLVGLPIAVMTGVYAAEYPESILGMLTRILLTIMMEFPTILVGLFVMQILVIPMGSYSTIAGALALAIVMMPYVAVYTEEAFRNIPSTYREAAFGLGLAKSKVVFRVLAGMAKKGIVTGMLIGIAKVAGETAPLLFTAGGASRIYFTGIDRPIGAIPLLIYNLVQQPYENYHEIAWGASLVLLLIFLAIFLPLRLSLKEVKL